MSNNINDESNIAPNWSSFRKLWIVVAVILFLLLFLLWLLGYGPGGSKCVIPPTVVEKEKLVDNPELLTKIGLLEKQNTQIPSLNTEITNLKAKIANFEAMKPEIKEVESPALLAKVAELEKSSSLVEGLQAKVKALEAIDINFAAATAQKSDDSAWIAKISELEKMSSLVPGLQAKIKSLEAIEPNFVIEKKSNPELEQKVRELEKENLQISGLKSRIKLLESAEAKVVTKEIDNPALLKRIDELEQQNSLIPGLKAKIDALEKIDVNFISPNTEATSAANVSTDVPDVAKLYFAIGSSRFPVDKNESLEKTIAALRSNSNSKATLVGYHDASGNAVWNRQLANKRANRVKSLLINAGIAENRILIDQPSQTVGSGDPEEARRVEVTVSN